MGTVLVTNQSKARRLKRDFDAVITIEDPRKRNPLRFHRTPHPEHLVLQFEDVDVRRPDIAMPQPEHLVAALEFGRRHRDGNILVHCRAGVARSTAVALMLIADRLGHGREREAVRELLVVRPEAAPNMLMLEMSDRLLGRDGELHHAWAEHEATDSELAQHRKEKLQILEKRPDLFSRSTASVGSSILFFAKSSVTPSFGFGREPLHPHG